ncbi:MAG: response regulator transcription factor [Gemmatimonadetes bacterium]|nr:response regulator transcription factor [Gemmatimonadota bacterium]
MNVLLVDDSSLLRARVAEALGEIEGVSVVGQAGTVADGIRLLGDLHPDVLVVDLRLPDGNGRQVLAAGKHAEWHPRVVILTNYGYPELRAVCAADGADAFLDKRTEFDQLSQVVSRWNHRNR